MTVLHTERLTLRRFEGRDLDPMIALHLDHEVMRYLGPLMSPEQTNDFLFRVVSAFDERGWGLFCAELTDSKTCIGFIGLNEPAFEADFTPCVEIGWRLARPAWGQGLATEGAREVRRFAHEELGLDEIVSFTTVTNEASQRVMTRIGLERDLAGDFLHPSLAPDDPRAPHVLFRGLAPQR
jgi:ribosomal-protein-alanine N-acetyltransferase